jgi:small subunit ribosomal protein S6
MALYESVFIVRQDVTAAQVDTLADTFAKIIDDNGGSIQRREYWGLRSLAFRIKKNRKGHYVLFNIDGPSDALQEMERNMRINEDVLRYMTIRVEELREEPSPIMQGKGDRERERADRGGRGRPDRPDRGDRPARSENDGDGAQTAAASDNETKSED